VNFALALDASRFADVRLGIVCPMANERATAVDFVCAVLDQCATVGFKSISFFVVLDNASRDDTRQLLERFREQRPELQVIWAPDSRGVADAYVRGYQEAIAAECDWILEIDAGFSHQPSDIPQFFNEMLKGNDCVFGSRFCAGGRNIGTIRRRVVSRGGTVLANILLGTKMTDMTSGFQLFTRPALHAVLRKGIYSKGPFFQTEMKYHCRSFRVSEVPIHYNAGSHTIGGDALRESFRNLWRLFRLRIRGQL
jgi:dolichol-phosphate mannosyltransferase